MKDRNSYLKTVTLSRSRQSLVRGWTRRWVAVLGSLIFTLFILSGCASCWLETNPVDFAPLPGSDWETSTPGDQGLDAELVGDLYANAAQLETLYGLLVVRNGKLIAEGYFNDGAIELRTGLASVTKSFTSALVGVALDQGHLTSVDETMVEFFPEFRVQISDPRKNGITIRDMLQMRSGYPWEERTAPYMEMILSSDNWLPYLVEFPLTSDPQSEYGYSNLTSHLLGVIVARAANTDLRSYAQEHLLSRIGAEIGDWWQDANGYYLGAGLISLTARDAGKFGLLYLNDGNHEGSQIIPAAWVSDSLRTYSQDINYTGWISSRLGRYFRDIGYGYQWLSARVGDHRFNFAWGHGGNLIVLLHDLDMVIVTTADPSLEVWGQESWKNESAIINLVGRFIKSLPHE